jgi:hypothetical protein
MGFQEYIALIILVSCILSIWPSHPNLWALIKFIMFLYFIILSSSCLVFIRQIPFSLVGPNIFLKTFLSKTISLLVIVYFKVYVSHSYITTGLITEQYNFNFVILDTSLLWNIFLLEKKALFPRTAFHPTPGSKRSSQLYKMFQSRCRLRTPDDGQKGCPKQVDS